VKRSTNIHIYADALKKLFIVFQRKAKEGFNKTQNKE
jgi:hypothetical protein